MTYTTNNARFNEQEHTKYSGWLCLIFLVISLFLIIISPRQSVEKFKYFVYSVVSPVPSALTQMYISIISVGDGVIDVFFAKQENRYLHKLVDTYQLREQQLRELERDNASLRKMLNLSDVNGFSFTAARVIMRDPQTWFQSIYVDRGKDAGLSVGAPVLDTNKNLVGQVIEVMGKKSRILLISDTLSAVVTSCPRTSDDGVIAGANNHLLYLRYLNTDSQVQPGDTMVTSRSSSSFPPGIPVGEVVRIERKEKNSLTNAFVRPYAKLSSLHNVIILNLR